MLDQPIHVYCIDIGSIEKNRFAWAYHPSTAEAQQPSLTPNYQSIVDLVAHVSSNLMDGAKVALGFESPLWIPVCYQPKYLTLGRPNEGSPAWSSQIGATVLATGLTQISWVLTEIKAIVPEATATLNWDSFLKSEHKLFIWEAFVSGASKSIDHAGDAKAAVDALISRLTHPTTDICPSSRTFSLIGAALPWARFSTDINLLREPTLVIKPTAKPSTNP